MNFVSQTFLIFFAIVFLGRLTFGQKKIGLYLHFLTLASLIFYGWYLPYYVGLLLFSTVVDYWAAIKIEEAAKPNKKKFLILSICANLGLLGYFKYANFFIDNFLTAIGQPQSSPFWNIVLPVGISFYTFQSMSYTIDVYSERLKAERSFPSFLLFVSFFPQLVAGPIVHAKQFLYQIPRVRQLHFPILLHGCYLIILGYFLKVVIADQLGHYVNQHWNDAALPGADAFLGFSLSLFFSGQIFADFCGYTSIALGLGYLLGFKFPENFNSPYIAQSFSNFWQRWHITLSSWLRDYLYVPLGGNRKGRVRTYLNLMIVMVLGGLWHGAANHFVLWGAIHGVALAIERLLRLNLRAKLLTLRFLWFCVVQATVLVAWVFFRAVDTPQAIQLLHNIGGTGRFSPDLLFFYLLLVPLGIMHLRAYLVEIGFVAHPGMKEKALLSGVMLYFVLSSRFVETSFIYFQF